jgi:hypothetical protein
MIGFPYTKPRPRMLSVWFEARLPRTSCALARCAPRRRKSRARCPYRRRGVVADDLERVAVDGRAGGAVAVQVAAPGGALIVLHRTAAAAPCEARARTPPSMRNRLAHPILSAHPAQCFTRGRSGVKRGHRHLPVPGVPVSGGSHASARLRRERAAPSGVGGVRFDKRFFFGLSRPPPDGDLDPSCRPTTGSCSARASAGSAAATTSRCS